MWSISQYQEHALLLSFRNGIGCIAASSLQTPVMRHPSDKKDFRSVVFSCGWTARSTSLGRNPESAATSEFVSVGSRTSEGIGVNRSVAVSGGSKIQF